MEELFRFMVVRPPRIPDKDDAISLEQETELQVAIAQAGESESPYTAIVTAAATYAAGEEFVDEVDELNNGDALAKLIATLDPEDLPKIETIRQAITDHFRRDLGAVVSSETWQTDLRWLRDSIIAIMFLRQEQAKPLAELAQALRMMDLIERFAAGDRNLRTKSAVRRVLRATLLMPTIDIPPEKRRQPSVELDDGDGDRLDRLERAREKESALGLAVDEMLLIPSDYVAAVNPVSVDQRDGGDFTVLNSSSDARFAGLLEPLGRFFDRFVGRDAMLSPEAPSSDAVSEPTLKPEAIRTLSETTRAVLNERGFDPANQSLEAIVNLLRQEREKTNDEIDALMIDPPATNVVVIGGTAFEVDERMLSPDIDIDLSAVSADNVPITYGAIQPVGVGDLLIVKQQLVRYEGHDVGHVENILEGEFKNREHRRKRTTEEFFLEERETQREEERDLQGTERFEIGRECSETIQQETEIEAGVNVTARYGPTVELQANAKFATSNSQQVSRKQSAEFSKEVVDKTVTRFAEKVREQRTLRLVEEVEEKNIHRFDNRGDGNGHVVGIYQWLDKIYEAQVFNYGLRTMYDIMIPEPAAFLLEAFKSDPAEDAGLTKPPDFTLKPSDITEANYHTYVAQYGATNVDAPPEYYVLATRTFSGGPSQDQKMGTFVVGADITVPTGYEAWFFYVNVTFNLWRPDAFVDALVGVKGHRFTNIEPVEWDWGDYLTPHRGTIPVAIKTFGTAAYVATVGIRCRITQMAREQWRLDTYAAIRQAYEQRLAEYEERLAELLATAGVTIQGRNPGYNERLIADELKKAAITTMTQQHYDIFDAIEDGSNSLPQVDLTKAADQGAYARFFEQAFEWENMTYVFYPYFWGRKEEWVARLGYDDPDPLFVNFVKAGAVRVVVPARPFFETAIDHFMQKGAIWNGGELPDITDPLYLPIIEEIKGQLGAPTKEVPWGDSWTVRVPTSLVRLRPKNDLPIWAKNEKGEWIPQE
jgi:hypothetical protein